MVIVIEVENAYISGKAVTFLKLYPTDVFALAQNKAALNVLIQDALRNVK